VVVIQYTFTLVFITTTVIGYVQYKNILAFDLGFNTQNILNIDTQGNKPDCAAQGTGRDAGSDRIVAVVHHHRRRAMPGAAT
jgi:hypothetical protein